MVMEIDGSISQLEYQAAVAAERAKKAKAVNARISKIKQQPKMTEPEAAAQYDLVKFWIPQIEKALQRSGNKVTNHSWCFRSRGEPEYVNALIDLLGENFRVYWEDDMWNNRYTVVCW